MSRSRELVTSVWHMVLTLLFALLCASPFIGLGCAIGIWGIPWYLSNHFVRWDAMDIFVVWSGGLIVFVCLISVLGLIRVWVHHGIKVVCGLSGYLDAVGSGGLLLPVRVNISHANAGDALLLDN